MSEAVLDIKQWGNNLGVRLPAAVARAARLHANQRVRVTVEKDRVVITPVAAKAHPMKRLDDAPFAQVLARLNQILVLS